jgi:SAM-dependent methyltransferase
LRRGSSFFGATKEVGEEKFRKFLLEHGDAYAEYYEDMGSRGFQANASRAAGALIGNFIDERGKVDEGVVILDSASGPEMLTRHIQNDLQDNVISFDINQRHFLDAQHLRKNGEVRAAVGSFVQMPFADGSFDYINFSLAFHYSRLDLRKKDYERLEVLLEINRTLKVGGRAVISLVHSLNLKNAEAFRSALETLGFTVVESYSGQIDGGAGFSTPCITLEKVRDANGNTEKWAETLGKNGLDGLKLTPVKGTSLKNSRRILRTVTLNGKKYDIPLNDADTALAEEEQKIVNEGQQLILQYGSVGSIPREQVVGRGFIRIRLVRGGKGDARYRLFKRGEKARGFIEVV